jgi:hypothetical protein
MSYTKSYTQRLAVRYNGTVSGVCSGQNCNHRNTLKYDGTAYEDVKIDIEVDTRPFDKSVSTCNTNVDLLTGAVVATEVAQVASIDSNSKKVAGTIVNGFFSYIKSEISQQITELSQSMDAQIMHLRELSQACLDKKRQMDSDFTRISGRYIKIFDDLNNELKNRIYELDKPTFLFRNELDDQHKRSVENDLVNVITVSGKEGGKLLSQISASLAKKRAFDTLSQAKIFLWQQKLLNQKIQKSMIGESIQAVQYSPVCYVEMKLENQQIKKEVHSTSYVRSLGSEQSTNFLIDQFSEKKEIWNTIEADSAEQIKTHFNRELNEVYEGLDERTTRIKKMIQKLADFQSMQAINY